MAALTTTLFTELLQSVGHARIEVLGSSMLPVIRPGDVLRVKAGPVQPGDIVVFAGEGALCAHRLISLSGGIAIARGDGNRRYDSPFPSSQILGRVIDLQRAGIVINNLSPRPVASLFIRNSFLLRRLVLRFMAVRRKRAVSKALPLNPSSSKLGA